MSKYDFIKAGNLLYWNDPDNGISSGDYKVISVPEEVHEDSIILIASRHSEAEVFASEDPMQQSGVLSFRIHGTDCEVLGETLGKQGVAVRSGLHCSPLAHNTAGTAETGTVRLSFSAFNRDEEVPEFLRVLRKCL